MNFTFLSKRPSVKITRSCANLNSPKPVNLPVSSGEEPRVIYSSSSSNNENLTPVEALLKIGHTGEKKGKRENINILISSFLAGSFLSVGGLLLLQTGGGTLALKASLPGLHSLLCGAVFPVGLVMIVITGVDLVTSNMMYATVPFLMKTQLSRTTEQTKNLMNDCIRYSGISYFGNFVASVFFAAAFSSLYGSGSIAALASTIAVSKTSYPFFITMFKGVLANWLVNIAILMGNSTNHTIGKIVLVWIPITIFVTLGFEHCVANMFFIPFGIFSGAPVTWSQFFFANLIPVTIGNYIGAAFLVSFLHSKAWSLSLHE